MDVDILSPTGTNFAREMNGPLTCRPSNNHLELEGSQTHEVEIDGYEPRIELLRSAAPKYAFTCSRVLFVSLGNANMWGG